MTPDPLILAIGDSLVAGYGLAPADSLPAQLERRLRAARPGVRVVNAGRSGDTSAAVAGRLAAVLSGLASRPALAIVQVGPNDLLRAVSPAAMGASLDAILIEFERCAIPVLLTTVEPPPILRDRARDHIGIHEKAAAQHGVATAPFFPAGVLGHRDMVLADRVHPNARAIGLVADGLLPVVERMLGATS